MHQYQTSDAQDRNGQDYWALDALMVPASGWGMTVGGSQVESTSFAKGVCWRSVRFSDTWHQRRYGTYRMDGRTIAVDLGGWEITPV